MLGAQKKRDLEGPFHATRVDFYSLSTRVPARGPALSSVTYSE